MRKINAIIHCDEQGKPVHPSKSANTQYRWYTLVDNVVMDEHGNVFSPAELTELFRASSPDAKAFRKQIYPLTDMDSAALDYGTCKVYVEEWTCPVCSTHNRHVDDGPGRPQQSICRHCKTSLSAEDIEEFEGVCRLEVDLNTMETKVIR